MKRIIPSLLLLCFSMLACAQGQHGIIRRNKYPKTIKGNTKKTVRNYSKEIKVKKKSVKSNKTRTFKTENAEEIILDKDDKSPKENNIIKEIINNMVYVQGGTFIMGATKEQYQDSESDEEPNHVVTLSSFHIGRYEITQQEWVEIMGYNPSILKGKILPVYNVSWKECQDFISKLNKITGLKFRLPTEAEWEFSAKGGVHSHGFKYSGSNIIDDVAWYDKNSNQEVHIVGLKESNELGLYDMSGNIQEWCNDWYGIYRSKSQNNPTGEEIGTFRVNRGGDWHDGANKCRVTSRNYEGSCVGLRLAM